MTGSRMAARLGVVPGLRWGVRLMRRLLGLRHVQAFAIDLFSGPDPWSLAPDASRSEPRLTRADVDDVPAAFVADPFLWQQNGVWYLFFEVMRSDDWRGVIGVATSDDLADWRYGGVVLDEPFHLSYPSILEWNGDTYMIPESSADHAVRLYRATRFPHAWTRERTLLAGAPFCDATVFQHRGHWWMLVEAGELGVASPHVPRHDTLRLYVANDLPGPWTEHPDSPIVAGDARIARPAGNVVRVDGRLVRFAQDCSGVYGRQVHAFEILELTPARYRERRLVDHAVAGPGDRAWNRGGMHHVDARRVGERWLGAVDGWSFRTQGPGWLQRALWRPRTRSVGVQAASPRRAPH